MKKEKNSSSIPQGLRYKLRISFYLTSVLPLLVTIYLVSNFILPQTGIKLDIAAIVTVSIFIAAIGFFVIKEVFDRVLNVSSEAKLIAAGDIHRRVEIPRGDEVGDLGEALNQLTQQIRSNMDELKNYSEKTNEINLEIQKRILVLSSLLQISSLISQGAQIEDILKVTVEKSRFIATSDVAYLLFKEDKNDNFYMKIADGVDVQHLTKLKVESSAGVFERMAKTARHLILDKQNIPPVNVGTFFQEQFKLKNTLAMPIFLRGKILGIMGIGNTREQFLFKKDDIELLDIFAKQVAIAVENDILIHKIEKLEIKDLLTGLYNEAFINNRLQEEIKRAIAYQRPCAYILVNIDNFKEFHSKFGALRAESVLKKVASLIRDAVTEIDRVGRVGDNEFAIVLPEKNKRQAQGIAEEIRKKIDFSFAEESEQGKRLTCSGGVSENPLDGIDAAELVAKARQALDLAKKQGKNRIAI